MGSEKDMNGPGQIPDDHRHQPARQARRGGGTAADKGQRAECRHGRAGHVEARDAHR